MTTAELMEFCRNLALLRAMRDAGTELDEKNALELTARLRAGRQRVQDAYRKIKDRLEVVLDYGRLALGEEEFEAARAEIDDAPAPEPKKRGRPAKPKSDDVPGQADLFADNAADQAKAAEDQRRALDPDLQLDLEIMQALRKGGRLSTQEIAEQVVRPSLDVAQRIAELERAGKIQPCRHARNRWECCPDETDTKGPNFAFDPQGATEVSPRGQNGQIDPSEAQGDDLDDEEQDAKWAPYRRIANAHLDKKPATTKSLKAAWVRDLGSTTEDVTRALEVLLAEGTLIADEKGKAVAIRRGDNDPFAAPEPPEAAEQALEEAPL